MKPDTPRTDKEESRQTQRFGCRMVKSDFARELERENAEIMRKWNSDRDIFCGALQLLKEAGIAPGSAELIAAADRFKAEQAP